MFGTMPKVYVILRRRLAQYPWFVVFYCRVTPDAGLVSQCPLIGVMSATMPMVYANLSLFQDKVSPVSLVSGDLLFFN